MKRVLAAVAALALLTGITLAIPVEKQVERSRLIPASVTALRAQLDDFHKWDAWLTPKDSRRISGSSAFDDGGKVWRWKDSDGKDWGVRRVSFSDEQLVLEALDGRYSQTMTLKPEGTGTRVKWSHRVTLRGLGRLAPLWKSVDEVIGPMLDEYLALLEKAAVAP